MVMRNVLNLFKNKFVIVTLVFIIWITFFSQYDLVNQRAHWAELDGMKKKIEFLQTEITRLEREKESLQTDSAVIEQYAREKYFMKTVHEDVYVFDSNALKK
jgi:cell division protein DivIC